MVARNDVCGPYWGSGLFLTGSSCALRGAQGKPEAKPPGSPPALALSLWSQQCSNVNTCVSSRLLLLLLLFGPFLELQDWHAGTLILQTLGKVNSSSWSSSLPGFHTCPWYFIHPCLHMYCAYLLNNHCTKTQGHETLIEPTLNPISTSLTAPLFPHAYLVAQTVMNPLAMKETWVLSLGQQDPWRREWLLTPVFLPGKYHGQRSLVGYSSWDCRVRHNWLTDIFTVILPSKDPLLNDMSPNFACVIYPLWLESPYMKFVLAQIVLSPISSQLTLIIL